MSPMFRRCEDCGGERLFEQPREVLGSCPGSAGDRCPEWSCTECGAALLAPMPAGAGRVA
jgi:hypothetical protein